MSLLETDGLAVQPLSPDARLCTELGICSSDLDELYFSALERLSRRPPIAEEEIHFEINLNDPTIAELARHIALNCPVMSAEEQAEAAQPSDPPLTTQGEVGLLTPPPNGAITASRAALGFAVLLFILAVIALVWMVTGT